jgi:hypothetical protein
MILVQIVSAMCEDHVRLKGRTNLTEVLLDFFSDVRKKRVLKLFDYNGLLAHLSQEAMGAIDCLLPPQFVV